MVKRAAGDAPRIGLILPDERIDLRPHPVDGVLIEARLGQGGFQKGRHLITVLGQHLHRHGDRIIARVEGNIGRQRLTRGGEALGIEIARPFLKGGGHQRGRPALAGRIKARPALEAQFQRGEGQRMLLHQPGANTAGRGNLLYLHRRMGGQRGHEDDGGRHEGADHCINSVVSSPALSGSIQPVTAWRLSSTSRAACRTSSTVTASRTAGQSCTSLIVSPVVSASP